MKNAYEVVIVGGGPTGMMLSGELRLAGVDAVLIERHAGLGEMDRARAGGLHARSIEILDQRGIAGRFLSEGKAMQVAGFAGVALDISDFPTRHNYGLALPQKQTERILAGWIEELAVPVYRGCEVADFAQDEGGVDVELGDGRKLRAGYLAGCDGGRSIIRKMAGIDFPGSDATVSHIIAEAKLGGEAEWGMRLHHDHGLHVLNKLDDAGLVGVLVTEPEVGRGGEPTLDDVKAALIRVYGTDYGIHSPTMIARFTDAARQAASYREGRVLIAGDAAHVHYPAGGQGLNLGIQDAVNLGWKLAQVVKGISPPSLLDTYQAERHPVAARVLETTLAHVALNRADDRSKAARAVVADLLQMAEPRKRFAGQMSGLDIGYDLGRGHPLLGRRMPDLDLITADGPVRTFALLREARPVLLNFGDAWDFDITLWRDRVRSIDVTYRGVWELPVIGAVAAPSAVLIRPDGYVAWVGEGVSSGLPEALATWFGPPGSPRAR